MISSIVAGLLDQLTVVFDRIARAFNRSRAARVVAFDILKAQHPGILYKLKSYRISAGANIGRFWLGIPILGASILRIQIYKSKVNLKNKSVRPGLSSIILNQSYHWKPL